MGIVRILSVAFVLGVAWTRVDYLFFCRKGRRYDYRVAVALSLFLGLFGIDRFYLGYPAIGRGRNCFLCIFQLL